MPNERNNEGNHEIRNPTSRSIQNGANQNESKIKQRICEECNLPLVHTGSSLVCPECGLEAETNFLRTDAFSNNIHTTASRNPNLGIYTETRVRVKETNNPSLRRALLSRANRMEYEDVQILNAQDDLSIFKEALNLTQLQSQEILTIFKHFRELKDNKGVPAKCFLSVIILKYLKNHNIYISIKQISKIAQIEQKKIQNTIKRFDNTLRDSADKPEKQIHLNKIRELMGKSHQNELIMSMFQQLDAELNFTQEAKNIIINLINRTNRKWFIGRNRCGILGGIVYYTQKYFRRQICREEYLAQQPLAERLNTTEITIRMTYKYFQRVFSEGGQNNAI